MTKRFGPRAAARRRHRQRWVGVVALPLSLLPFAWYFTHTDNGRVLAARVESRVDPPSLPALSDADRTWAASSLSARRDVPVVLVYHGVGGGSAENGMYTVSVPTFTQHLAYLKASGANVITVAELARLRTRHLPVPARTVVVTFDDGRAEAMLWADPALRSAGMSATMFVIGSAAQSAGNYYADGRALQKYAASGRWDLQAHTFDMHVNVPTAAGPQPALTNLQPGESIAAYRKRIATDLDEVDAVVERLTGKAPVAFAYPFGAHGTDRSNDPRIADELRRAVLARYLLAFHQDDQTNLTAATCAAPPEGVRRLTVPDISGRALLERIRAITDATPETSCAAP